MPSSTNRAARSALSVAAVLAVLTCHTAAQAALDARANMTVRKLPVGSPTPVLVFQDSVRDLDPTGSFAGIGLSPSLSYVTPESGARVRYGAITSFAHADGNHPGDAIYYSNAGSSGRFTDQFRMTSPGVTGSGTMTLHATARAVFDYDPQGSTDTTDFTATGAAYVDLFVNGRARVQDRYTTRYWADISEGILARMSVDVRSLNGDVSIVQHDTLLAGTGYTVVQHFALETTFQFGSLININALLTVPGTANACCSPGDGVDAVSNAWFRWDGISDVKLADGTQVTDFEALGAVTGFDYAQAAVVPEPSARWMMLAGMASVLLARRRRNPSGR